MMKCTLNLIDSSTMRFFVNRVEQFMCSRTIIILIFYYSVKGIVDNFAEVGAEKCSQKIHYNLHWV